MTEDNKPRIVLHKSETRGCFNHGWLQTCHTFSFADYRHPDRMGFGMLRVLNDDIVSPGRGFGTHSHQNMEITSIPLSGSLGHKDSTGSEEMLRTGEVQVMSAGRGITHSEKNPSSTNVVNFLQIWIFPASQDLSPRYHQSKLDSNQMENQFLTIVGPEKSGLDLWIHQNAWLSMGNFSAGQTVRIPVKENSNGIYLFLIEGSVHCLGKELTRRDGLGIIPVQEIDLEIQTNSRILLIEVPFRDHVSNKDQIL